MTAYKRKACGFFATQVKHNLLRVIANVRFYNSFEMFAEKSDSLSIIKHLVY